MLGLAFRNSLADFDTLGQLSRYESALVRQFEATLAHLKRARADGLAPAAGKMIDLTPVKETETTD